MISNIKITNFLKIKNIEFDLLYGNVIMGPSNYGKTTILKLIRNIFNNDKDKFIFDNFFENTKISFNIVEKKLGNSSFSIVKKLDENKIAFLDDKNKEIDFYNIFSHLKVIYMDYYFDNNDFQEIFQKSLVDEIQNDEKFVKLLNKKLFETVSFFYDETNILCKEINLPHIFNPIKNLVKEIDYGEKNKSILYKSIGFKKEFIFYNIVKNLQKYENKFSYLFLIDEIENSLSIEIVEEIANLLVNNNFQVIASSNDPFLLPKKYNFLSLSNEFNSQKIYRGLAKSAVIFEGKNDINLVGENFFKDNIFSGGGKNIEVLYQQLGNSNYFDKLLAIVDNDSAGKSYYDTLSEYIKKIKKEDKYLVYKLKRGTIEDYYKESSILKIIKIAKDKKILPNNFIFDYEKGNLLTQIKHYFYNRKNNVLSAKVFKNFLNENLNDYFDLDLLRNELIENNLKDFLN